MNKEPDFNYSNKYEQEKSATAKKSNFHDFTYNISQEFNKKGKFHEKSNSSFYEVRNFSNKKNYSSFRDFKYFYVFYNNNNYSLVKDFLLDKSLKILKPNHSIFYSRELEYCPNVYFMFINNDKKLIKGIMKKRFLKYDRETRKILENILLDTKTKYLLFIL
jgi:hypothetical protein